MPVLKAEYLNWDDDIYFTANPDIESAHGWSSQFARFTTDANVYPIVFGSFKIENALVGKNARVSHAINLVLHGLVSVSAFFLLCRWVPDWRIAFWASLLFAVHPLQVSTVAWVAERKSLLGSLFFLWALIAADSKKAWIVWGSLLLAGLGYLCKSPLVVFPAILVVADLFLRPGQGRRWALWGAHAGLATVFAWVYSGREVSQSLSLGQRLELVPASLGHYLEKWVCPIQMLTIYPKWDLTGAPVEMIGWIPIVGVVLLMVLFRKRIDPLEWFGVLLFAITLAPALGFVSFGYQKHSFVSDHFMYLPLLGLAIVLSFLMTRISIGRGFLFPAICLFLVLMWALVSWRQCGVWRNPVAFWQSVLHADETSWVAHENLATYLDGEGELEEAAHHYRRAVEIDPEEPIGWINLGRNQILRGEYEEAVHSLARAIDLNVYYVEAHLFRAEAFLRMGEEQKAVDQFHSAIAVRPGNVEARLKIADLLLHAKNPDVRSPDQAIRWLRPFIDAPPSPSALVAWKFLAEAHAT
ncbi:MAG: tetratricopeptide repeat protein, partial [Candidatus Omnitrophica bacterium]|nr:tetratricopeptide repeat protein [Candidatus Omnitrophota bacterium]